MIRCKNSRKCKRSITLNDVHTDSLIVLLDVGSRSRYVTPAACLLSSMTLPLPDHHASDGGNDGGNDEYTNTFSALCFLLFLYIYIYIYMYTPHLNHYTISATITIPLGD